MTILAATNWHTNADMVCALVELGYLKSESVTLDPTFGYGKWWTKWQPKTLIASDLDKNKTPTVPVDFTELPHPDDFFDCVTFDPPYKLNGTPSGPMDERFGVHVRASVKERHELICSGINETARVLKVGGFLILRCQDQVSGGKVRWQTIEFTNHANAIGLSLVDRLDRIGHRPQPEGRTQQHARRNLSSMLVFKKEKRPKKDNE